MLTVTEHYLVLKTLRDEILFKLAPPFSLSAAPRSHISTVALKHPQLPFLLQLQKQGLAN